MKGKSKVKLSTLNLVYPPVSNRVASMHSDDKEFARIISNSDFYMIGGRAAACFANVVQKVEEGTVSFDIVVAGGPTATGRLHLGRIKRILEDGRDEVPLRLSWGDDELSVWIADEAGESRLAAAYSPESALMTVGRKDPSPLTGLENYRELMTFDLLYVGIAKVGDTFSRLIGHGHHARQKILSEEPQRYPGASVTDEIFLFAFKVDPMFVRTFGADADIEDEDVDFSYNPKPIVADAEKAFVSLLKPPYNRQLFANYPRGKDGLYNNGLDSYSYSIAEGMTFRTSWGDFHGARSFMLDFSNEADSIMVKGDEITIYIGETETFLVSKDGDPESEGSS
ncbi:hypothetical protein J2X57_002797 [Luteibacter sp. 1214]|uniref:hypothetical protein n=1 Tax=Luteibacter sp. 1214 TaxID=2817735 RepID=UPI0028619D05|nr:hypothetical protein [Luteibacter sp. 1214]MDR6643576.1 hypothetical protein [Luteibacter sp. 1214]